MSTFDFGAGPVPAHRHQNGGGWVADTAHVDPSAYVGRFAMVFGRAEVYGDAEIYGAAEVYDEARISGDALVFGSAKVFGSARVSDNAMVYGDANISGDARIYGCARISGNAWDASPFQMQCGRWSAYDAGGGEFGVGCQVHTIEYWREAFDAIAYENGATDLERELARLALHTVCTLRGIEVEP